MTDTERALLNAVCAAPDADEPRLVYADFLDERGDGTDRERAEFIRCQIEHSSIPVHECDSIYPGCFVDLSGPRPYVGHNHKCRGYRPQQRYIELWDRHGKEWFGETPVKMNVIRGFPDRIECRMYEFMGGACERCANGTTSEDHLNWEWGNCTACRGTGRREGLADVAARELWPVRRVVVSDVEPDQIQHEGVGQWCFATDPDDAWNRPNAERSLIPKQLFDAMNGFKESSGPMQRYDGEGEFGGAEQEWVINPTRDLALAALSDAAVRVIGERRKQFIAKVAA